MKAATTTITICVLVDEDGDYEVGTDATVAGERYAENIGELTGERGVRRVEITLTVPLPSPIQASVEVDAEESEAVIRVK